MIIGAAIGGVFNWAANGAEFTWDGLGYFGIGAVAGAVGAGVGAGISSAMAGGSFGAGFAGSSTAMTASSSFVSGAAIGGGAGFSGGYTTGFGNALVGGENLGNAFGTGLKAGLIGGVSGGLIGGAVGGITASKHGGDFWSGKGAIYESAAPVGLTPENVKVGEGMEYTTEYATGVADGTYGKPNFVERIVTNKVPVGEGYTLKNGCIINKNGGMANGLTKYLGKGISEVYLGKSAFTSVTQLKLTIGHEYIHATQNYMAFKKVIKNVNATYRGYPMAEIAAHNWVSTMGVKNGFGAWTGRLGAWSWSRKPYYNWLLNANF